MKYDPIKNIIGNVVGTRVLLRRLFYTLLGILFLREWHVKRELRRILKMLPSTANIYDAGSGFGQYSYYMVKRNPKAKILGVDVKEEQVRDCTEFFENAGLKNATFNVEDLTKPNHTDKFDFILSVDVMEHIVEDVTVFKNFSLALHENGLVLINTPSDLGGSDAHDHDDESFVGEHARNGYSIDDISAILKQAGLSLVIARYTYGRWGDFSWRLAIKLPMRLLNRSMVFFLLLPIYYIFALIPILLFMCLDYFGTNPQGAGLIVIAKKSSSQ
jgi:SAM-dependent methyltransferase